VTRYAYDMVNRLARVTDADGQPHELRMVAIRAGTASSSNNPIESQPVQYAAMDEIMRQARSAIREIGGGGAGDGVSLGPPAPSFSGSRTNPLQAPEGPRETRRGNSMADI
jgi:hypothetical protein